eukprot:5018909-Amphidinium_carterae.1
MFIYQTVTLSRTNQNRKVATRHPCQVCTCCAIRVRVVRRNSVSSRVRCGVAGAGGVQCRDGRRELLQSFPQLINMAASKDLIHSWPPKTLLHIMRHIVLEWDQKAMMHGSFHCMSGVQSNCQTFACPFDWFVLTWVRIVLGNIAENRVDAARASNLVPKE